MVRFSFATGLSTVGSALFNQCDRLIVGAVLGPSLLGVYSAITSLAVRINSFSGSAVQPLVPALSRGSIARTEVEGRIRQAAHLNAFIALGAGLPLYLLADRVMQVLVPGTTQSQFILGLQIATIIYCLYSMSAPGYFALFSSGGVRTNAIIVLGSAVLSLALIFVGARYFGFVGAIAGNVGFVGTLIMLYAGIGRLGVSMRQYFTWITVPLCVLLASLLACSYLMSHLGWRIALVVVDVIILAFWFVQTHSIPIRSALVRNVAALEPGAGAATT
jgi:O-antigen/teichoic acid export membrane protein